MYNDCILKKKSGIFIIDVKKCYIIQLRKVKTTGTVLPLWTLDLKTLNFHLILKNFFFIFYSILLLFQFELSEKEKS